MATGVIYIGRDNTVTLQLTDDGVAQDLSSATKFEVTINGVSVNSVDTPAAFDLSDAVNGNITLAFGGQALTEGTYNIRVVVFDATNTDGIVWVHEDDPTTLSLKVIED